MIIINGLGINMEEAESKAAAENDYTSGSTDPVDSSVLINYEDTRK